MRFQRAVLFMPKAAFYKSQNPPSSMVLAFTHYDLLAPIVGIQRLHVQWILLAGSLEQGRVDVPIRSTKSTVEEVVWDTQASASLAASSLTSRINF